MPQSHSERSEESAVPQSQHESSENDEVRSTTLDPAPLNAERRTLNAVPKEDREQESERRKKALAKHKDRFHEIDRLYSNSPDYVDRIKAAIHEIFEQEGIVPANPLPA